MEKDMESSQEASIQSALTMLEREAAAIWYADDGGYQYAHGICLITRSAVKVSVTGRDRLEVKAERPTVREAFEACHEALAETDPRMLARTLGIEDAA